MRKWLALLALALGLSHAQAQTWTKLNTAISRDTAPYRLGVDIGTSGADFRSVGTITTDGVFVPSTLATFSCAAHQWLSAASVLGVSVCTQPDFSDLSGTINAPFVINAQVSVNTRAQLAALPYSYAMAVVRLGYAAPGDAPAVLYTRNNAACSLNAGAGDDGSQVPTSDGKCWIASFQGKVPLSQFGAFPGTANDTQLQYAVDAAGRAGFPLVFDKQTGLTNPASPSNCYQVTAAIALPSAAGGGTTWEFNNPFSMEGPVDSKYRACIRTSGAISAPAYFYNTGIGGTTGRTANAGFTARGLDFIGPQDWANGACAIGLDNQRTFDISDASFFGYVGLTANAVNPHGGCSILVYSYQIGGSFGGLIQRTQHGVQHYSVLTGSNTVYSFDDLRVWGVRNGVIMKGPYQTSGKVSDIRLKDNRYECAFVSANVLIGSGTWTSSAGSSQNTKVENSFYTAYCSHAMEKGTLSAVTSASVMTLRTTASTYLYSGTDFTSTPTGAPMILRVADANGRYWAAPIQSASGRTVTLAPIQMLAGTLAAGSSTTATLPATGVQVNSWYNTATLTVTGGTCSGSAGPVTAYVGSTRVATVTLSPACTPDATSVFTLAKPPLPFTPTTSSDYELGYADSLGAAAWPQNPLAYGHAVYYGQGANFVFTDEGSYYENAQMVLAKGSSTGCMLAQPQTACDPPNAQTSIEIINANPSVMRGWHAFYEDGSPFLPKGLNVMDEIAIGGVAAARVIKNGIVGDPVYFGNINPLMFLAINATGHTLNVGDVVEIDNNGGGSGKFNAIEATGGSSKCYVVTAPTGGAVSSFPDGQPVTLALSGQFVKVYVYSSSSTAVGMGDVAIAQAPVAGKGSGSGAGTSQNVTQASATVAQLARACGVYQQTTTGGVANAGVTPLLLRTN